MKKASFTVKKWIVRMLVTVGGVLGFASCHHSGDSRNEDSKGSSTMLGSPSAISTRDVSEVEPAFMVHLPNLKTVRNQLRLILLSMSMVRP